MANTKEHHTPGNYQSLSWPLRILGTGSGSGRQSKDWRIKKASSR
jgi:hypothetical protein